VNSHVQPGFGVIVHSVSGVCGASDLQPSCTTFGLTVFGMAAVVLCLLTTIGMVLLRRRLAPLLKASGLRMASAFLSLVVPLMVMALFFNKLAGAMVVMMVFPIFMSLLFAGVVCFLAWGAHTAYRAFGK